MERMIGKYVAGDTVAHFARAEAALTRALELNPDLSVGENDYCASRSRFGAGRAIDGPPPSAGPRTAGGSGIVCRAVALAPLLRPPQASLAAVKQARRLDPKFASARRIRCFMLGDCEGVLEYEPKGISYMRNLAL